MLNFRWSLALGTVLSCLALGSSADETDLPVVAQDDFERGAQRWNPLDPEGWKIRKAERGAVLSQFKKESPYRGPHRSPFHIALLKEVIV